MGANGTDGELLLFRKNGDVSDSATAAVHLEGGSANLLLGANGTGGDLFLFSHDGDISDKSTATVHLDGSTGDLRMGAAVPAASCCCSDRTTIRTDPDNAVVSLDSLGNLRMGGGGEDGDIFLFPAGGNRSNSDTATVHVEGETATIRMGGRGVPGEVVLFPSGGDRTDNSTATISIDAEFANTADGRERRRRRHLPLPSQCRPIGRWQRDDPYGCRLG